MRIIGCGNRDRTDDGAGVLVAERLRFFGVQAEVRRGEALELIEAWSGAGNVIVVDTAVTGAAPGTVHEWDSQLSWPCGHARASSHGLGVPEAVELARALGRLPLRLRIYGIEGRDFSFGNGLSPRLAQAAEEVVRRILAQVEPGRVRMLAMQSSYNGGELCKSEM